MSECGCGLLWVGETLFWVGGVSGDRWDIILGGWGWVGKYFGWVRVGGGEWGWVHCLIMPLINFYLKNLYCI